MISIIIPTLNRAHYLQETLDSVLAQTYTNWECIIVDDGSTDNTEYIVNKYLKLDNRFKYNKRLSNSNNGASSCRNIGIEHAKGSYIQFLDSDDVMELNKLESQIKLLNLKTDSIATCSWGRFNEKPHDSVFFKNLEVYRNFENIELFIEALKNSKGYFPIHAYLIPKTLIEKSGYWNEYLSLNDDKEFLIRLFCHVREVVFAEDTRVYYRWTTNTNVSSFNEINKVRKALYSWVLIENQLKIRFDSKIAYTESMKEGIYFNLKKSFPELIEEFSFFFIKQLKKEKNWFFRIKFTVYKILVRLWKKIR